MSGIRAAGRHRLPKRNGAITMSRLVVRRPATNTALDRLDKGAGRTLIPAPCRAWND